MIKTQNENEFMIYFGKILRIGSIPRFYDSFLKPNEDKAVLIMELLGLNLRELFDEYEYFSTPTVMRIGLQVVSLNGIFQIIEKIELKLT